MMIAALLAGASPSPTLPPSVAPAASARSAPALIPDGTYTYEFRHGTSKLGTVVITVQTSSSGAVNTHEIAVLGRTFTVDQTASTSTYVPSSLHAIYPGAKPVTIDVTFGPTYKETIAGMGSHDVTPSPGAKGVVVLDGPVMSGFFLAAVEAHTMGTTTLAAFSPGSVGPMTIDLKVPSANTRPSTLPATELGYVATGLPSGDVDIWYDPATFVPQEIDVTAQGIAIVLVSHTKATAAPQAPSAPAPLPTAEPHFRSVDTTFVSSDGTKLAGTLTIPDAGPARMPAVLLVHGSGPTDRDETIGPNPIFLQLSNALSNHGYIVLRYDKRGIGQSGGNAATTTRDQLLADARAGIAFLLARVDVAPSRVFVVGHSEGGELAPSLAAHGAPLRGIALMAPPALPIDQILVQQVSRGLTGDARAKAIADQLSANAAIRAGKSKAPGAIWLRTSFGIDPADVIKRVPCPILILQGGKDFQVLAKDLPRLVDAATAAHRDVTVHVFPNDDHLFITVPTRQTAMSTEYLIPHHVDPAVISALLAWLDKH